MKPPVFADVLRAAERIRAVIRTTPVRRSDELDRRCGAALFFKCENLQVTGAFKARGAANAVLGAEATTIAGGVATHSSGNHGAALAWAAALRGVPAFIVVPRDASPVKRAAIARHGAQIIDCGPTLAEREAALAEVVARAGAHVVPPYDDPRIIAGQGTAALELCSQVSGLDAIVAPVGGGGMISGAILAASPGVRVTGAEPALAADAALSLRTGIRQPQMPPKTVADGLRTSLGELNFGICRDYGLDIVLVDEAEILDATHQLTEVFDMPVETSSAVAYAAVCKRPPGQRTGIILTGGNVAPVERATGQRTH